MIPEKCDINSGFIHLQAILINVLIKAYIKLNVFFMLNNPDSII